MKVTGALLALPGLELTPMAEVRFDVQYPTLRKVAGLSDAAFRLHTAAIFWCAWNHTDGFVPEEDLDLVCAQVRDPARFAAECVRRGTWHMAAQACGTDDCPEPRDEAGWVIHDWRIYPAGDEVEVTEKKSSGGKLGNHRRWHAGRGVKDPECPWCKAPSVSESDSDRYPIRTPISVSDRSANPRSRSKDLDFDLSLVDPVSQSSRRNASARGTPIQSPITVVIDGGLGRDPDDDDLLKVVKRLIRDRTGQVIYADKARFIAADILGRAKGPVPNRARYVETAIRNEPDPAGRWLTAGAGAAGAAGAPERPPWCGQCDERTRKRGWDGDHPEPCPNCSPKARSA